MESKKCPVHKSEKCFCSLRPEFFKMETKAERIEKIHGVIKKFLLDYNITLRIGECGTSGAGRLLSEAIAQELEKDDDK